MFFSTKVREIGNYVEITNFPKERFLNDIKNVWKTSKLHYLFEDTFTIWGKGTLKINKFFIPELIYIIDSVPYRKHYHEIKELLYTNTWIGMTKMSFPNRIHLDRLNDLNLTLKNYQLDFLKLYDIKKQQYHLNGYILAYEMGLGKQLPLDAIIYTENGPKLNKDLTLKDKVIGSDGKPKEILGLYPQEKEEYYKIIFKDKTEIECSGNHLWSVDTSKQRKNKNSELEVLTTKEIYNNLLNNSNKKINNYSIPYLSSPAEFTKKELKIDPYLMGVILGDGCISTRTNTIVAGLKEFEMLNILSENKLLKKIKDQKRNACFSILPEIREILKEYDLYGCKSDTKFIPENYLYSSIEDRISLLQGLMDTDGNNKKIYSEFTTTSPFLAKQIQELVFSLSGKAVIYERNGSYRKNGVLKITKKCYRVYIQFPEGSNIIPFRLKRKAEKFIFSKKNRWHKYISKIEKIEDQAGQCIKVNSGDSLFATKNFTLTHNTITSLSLMNCLGKDGIIIVAPKSTLVNVWKNEIDKFFIEKQNIWVVGDNFKDARFFITNYESLDKLYNFHSVFRNKANLGIIVDEMHNFKNIDAKRTKVLIDIQKLTHVNDILLMSGTPIKALGKEMIPALQIIDPFFDLEAEMSFKKALGVNVPVALDVLKNRLGLMMHRKTKEEVLNLPKKYENTVNIKIYNGDHFTIENVKDEIIKFSESRKQHYAINYNKFKEDYDISLEYFRNHCTRNDNEFMDYKSKVAYFIKNGYNYRSKEDRDDAVFCNSFENKYITPCLPNELKKKFVKSKSVVKYVELTIMGEVIGGLLNKMRSEMFSSMLENSPLCELIAKSEKKTVCFTTFVDVAKGCENYVKNKCKYDPLLVYGDTTKNIVELLKSFRYEENKNPLIATIQTLSTGVTLNEASSCIFLNKPWRYVDYVQAYSRIYRLGQDTEVQIYNFVLDTGGKPNLSTRMEDIVNWSKEMFEGIVGTEYYKDTITEMFNLNMNGKQILL